MGLFTVDGLALPQRYGKYELLEHIGSGGMAEVFRARLAGVAGFEKIVVIKRLHPHFATDANMVQMFVDEAKLAACVQHKNVVQVYELDRLEGGDYYIVMEYVAGTDLKRLLRSAERKRRRLPPWLSVYTTIEVLDALGYAYDLTDAGGRRRNIVHRDVSPENIFISSLGDVKLGDFGVAKDDTRAHEPFAKEVKGKLGYIAPEQLSGERLDQRCDVFAAGVVLWECLSQRRLFRGESPAATMALLTGARRVPPSEHWPDIPPELDKVVISALQPNRKKRVNSALELQAQLLEILAKLRPGAGPVDVRGALAQILNDPARDVREPDMPRTEEITDAFIVDVAPIPRAREASPAESMVEDLDALHPVEEETLDDVWGDGGRMPAMRERGDSVEEEPFEVTVDERCPCPLELEILAQEPPPARHLPEPGPETPTGLPRPHDPREEAGWDGTYAIINPRLRRSSMETDDLIRERVTYEIPIPGRPSNAETSDIVPIPPRLPPALWSPPAPTPGATVGPASFWLRQGAHRSAFGPCSFKDVSAMLRSAIAFDRGMRMELSPDGERWMPMATFLELIDRDAVDEHEALPAGPLMGTLALPFGRRTPGLDVRGTRSLIALLAELTDHGVTGRLIVSRESGATTERAEVHVVRGVPVHVASNAPELETSELLVTCRLLDAAAMAECLHTVLAEERPLTSVLSDRAGLDFLEHRPKLMMTRLEEILRWAGARFVFSPTPPAAGAQFARSPFALLIELIQRTHPPELMAAALGPLAELPLDRPKHLEVFLGRLRPTPAERQSLEPLLVATTLSDAVAIAPVESRFLLAAAALLLEARALFVGATAPQ